MSVYVLYDIKMIAFNCLNALLIILLTFLGLS